MGVLTGKGAVMATISRRIRSIALVSQLGPGLITGAADDDPSGIATYSQAGAQFGYGLLWTLFLTYPLMTAIQLISANIGRVTGAGLAKNMGAVLPRWLVTSLVTLLFTANTINIGADIAAMGSAADIVARHGGFPIAQGAKIFAVGFAVLSLGLQLFIPYHRYVKFLKWLTMALFAYVAVVFIVHIDWLQVATSIVIPPLTLSKDAVTTIVAVFGTTISPYLFFWQAAEEVEEVDKDPDAHPLTQAPKEARGAFKRMRIDTFVGMAFSNLIALAIMISTAATLHAHGVTDIQTASQAAEALAPVAGPFAFALFAIGIIGTGLLAVPVLAGSSAYAVGESRGWKTGLEHQPWEAIGFYAVIALGTLLGMAIIWSPLDPIKALFWSAVINGVAAVPIMAAMMIVASRHSQMGHFTANLGLKLWGWAATAVMAVAAVAMFAFAF
jgi:NRAMP (natural resistance-associated macrophage protein)-like metal ion transporter